MSREKQRRNHSQKWDAIRTGARSKHEEPIEFRDFCGMRDPTPYEAVKHMVKEQRKFHN